MTCCCLQISPVDPTQQGDPDDRLPIISGFQESFRDGRDKLRRTEGEKLVLGVLKISFCSAGYWLPSRCCFAHVIWLLLVSSFQLGYDLFIVFHCPNKDCRFLIDDNTHTNPVRTAQNVAYTLASVSGFFSYIFMILTLYLTRKKKNALGPCSIMLDVGKKKLFFLFCVITVLISMWVASTSIFYYLVRDEISLSLQSIMLTTGVGSQLVTQWTGIISCFVFGASSLALATFAEDVKRRLADCRSQNINQLIVIHREYSRVVSDTVESFAVWFVFHWILYGLTTIVALVVVVTHFGGESDTLKKTYVFLFFIVHLFIFTFPCGCAAYITSTCNGLLSNLNNTVEEDWQDPHIFKQREKLQLFITYARESAVGFRIGRVTFTSTLAWVSLFLGSSGLLFRFF